ncbi:MAG TPA: SpoIIE family protein phosphatase [candidate division Zixibacteria bacterium]|nr:SpoIIE family protein phosphatase [candidate division Zixibacteria bacterium]
MLKLAGTDGKRYYSWSLDPGSYILGRKPECDFSVTDKTVSRNHARIEVDSASGTCKVVDLGSHNGTTVNGNRITEATLKAGDQIMFGSTEFRMAEGDDAETRPDHRTAVVLTENDPGKSVYLSINEALKPLPSKITERPDLIPALFDMAKMLVLPEPKEIMLQRSLEMIARLIQAERLAVLFVSEDQEEIYPMAVLKPGGRDPGAFNLSRTIVNEIMANKNAILICDAREDPRFAEQKSIIMSELRSAMAVPLFDQDRVHGILYVDTTNPMHQYNDDHLRVLATFGNLIASRLLNYELLSEREEKQVIEAEMKRAASIQKKLLSQPAPSVEGYRIRAFQEPSRSVGGDLYDVTILPDGRLFFVVADVSGKGMGAAMLMSNILASLRILYNEEKFELCPVVERVSAQLLASSEQEDFATLFCGAIDPATGETRYVNCGHNAPLLVRADGSFEHLAPSGIMIGAFPGMTWSEASTVLGDGDLIFMFSDGVTEAEGDEGMYGEERTEKLIIEHRAESPDDIAGRLVRALESFRGDNPQSDDITLLIIKKAGQ